MRRHRVVAASVAAAIALLASGCMGGGGDEASEPLPAAAVPTSAVPVAVAPASLGGKVTAGPETPKNVVAALKGDDVIVVVFLNKDAADDQKVAAAVQSLRSDPVARSSARVFDYVVGKKRFGDLADLLGVEGTPSVAVIARDRTLVNLFTGLVDADILRQSVADAAETAAAHPSVKPSVTS